MPVDAKKRKKASRGSAIENHDILLRNSPLPAADGCDLLESGSERIPRGLPRGKRANDVQDPSLGIEDSPELAPESFKEPEFRYHQNAGFTGKFMDTEGEGQVQSEADPQGPPVEKGSGCPDRNGHELRREPPDTPRSSYDLPIASR